MPFKGLAGAFCRQHTQRSVEAQYEWKVEDFFSLSTHRRDWYESPDIRFSGRTFFLQLWTNSLAWIGVFLELKESSPPITIRYTLGIKTAAGDTELWKTDSATFSGEADYSGSFACIKRSDLLLRRQQLAPRDALTITLSLKVDDPLPDTETAEVAVQATAEDVGSQEENEGGQALEPTKTSEVAVQTSPEDIDNDRNDESWPLEKTGHVKIAEDLGKLWCSGDNSDVILKVEDVEFKAHRAVLCARTPVFRAMFKHNTEEAASGVVTITDCQPKNFEEFLHYVYSGYPRELTTKNACALYALAEKYLVADLKTQCLQYVRNALCVETFCNTVQLALTHGEAELLEEAVDFAAGNIQLIIRSVGWQQFIEERPTEANEILIKALGPRECGR